MPGANDRDREQAYHTALRASPTLQAMMNEAASLTLQSFAQGLFSYREAESALSAAAERLAIAWRYGGVA